MTDSKSSTALIHGDAAHPSSVVDLRILTVSSYGHSKTGYLRHTMSIIMRIYYIHVFVHITYSVLTKEKEWCII